MTEEKTKKSRYSKQPEVSQQRKQERTVKKEERKKLPPKPKETPRRRVGRKPL
jgi:hypothetical protein